MKTKEIRRSEDAAEIATVKVWKCKNCGKQWGDSERAARYCCSNDFPCECGGRREKHYVCCKLCREKDKSKQWFAKDITEWDGNLPLALWDDEKYFFDSGELEEYLMEFNADDLESIQLTTCKPNNGRHFEMSEHLQDELPEDGDVDDKEINKVVNDWIKDNAPFSWSATGVRLCARLVLNDIRD